MLSAMSELNLWGVLLATVVGFVAAGIYFGVIIAKPYNVSLGRTNQPPSKPTPLFIVGPLACSLIVVIATATLLRALHIESLVHALQLGSFIGIGFILPMCMNIAINPNFPRPFLYFGINAPYFFLNSLATSAILYWMA